MSARTPKRIGEDIEANERELSTVLDEFIAAGRGHEKPSEWRASPNPLAQRYFDVIERGDQLRDELRDVLAAADRRRWERRP
jgi:hypothetical protein